MDYLFIYFQVFVPIIQIDKVLPNYNPRLGGSRPAGLSPRVQHAQSPYSSQELELLAFGLQLQLETCENAHHKREKKVAVRKWLVDIVTKILSVIFFSFLYICFVNVSALL